MTDLIDKSHYSIYDFMGYIIPGCFFTSVLFIVFIGIGSNSTLVSYITHSYDAMSHKTANPAIIEIVTVALVFFFALVIFYLVGHFIATIGHLTIDRILVFSLLKYPIIKKLGFSGTNDYFIMAVHAIIWGLFLISYFFLLLFLLLRWRCGLNISLNTLLISLAILWCRIVLIPIFSNSADDLLVKNEHWLGKISKSVYTFVYRCSINPMAKLLFLEKKFHHEFIDEIKQRYQENFNVKMSESDTNTYWLIHHYVVSHSSVFEKYKNNWLRLYGLCRNIAMASSLICGLQVLLTLKYSNVITATPNMQVCFLCALIAPIFLFRYLILYYNYYTKNLIRAFYLLTTPSCNNSNYNMPSVSFSFPNWSSADYNRPSEPD